MSTLSLVNLRKQFGEVVAVNDISFEVADGEFLCILGPSGCGKSTALRMIGGFEMPTGGDVQIDGVSVVDQPPNKRPTAMVFQKYTLWPHMKVSENIAFGLQLRGLPRAEIAQKVQESLTLVGLPTYGNRYPTQLSGGEQQRIALARALVLRPKILLLDEPFSNLDALLRVRLREELRRIQRQVRITAIFVTHDQEEALSLADRIVVMNKGHIEQIDKPSAIYSNPASLFVADFIGTMNLIPGTVTNGAITLGGVRLPAPDHQPNGPVTVAIRPEELALAAGGARGGGLWDGVVSQLMDLGHYRKALIDVQGAGLVKVYVAKTATLSEGDSVSLYPLRYMVYTEGGAPVEIRQQPIEGVAVYQ